MSKRNLVNKLTKVSDNPQYEIELILMHLLGVNREKLLANEDTLLTKDILEKAHEIVEKRLKHIPLQYLLGHKWFMGRKFEVNEHTFIPRDDTEILVEKAIGWLDYRSASDVSRPIKFLEIGTGSGAIVTSVVGELIDKFGIEVVCRDFEFIATDIAPKTLEQAKRNFSNIHGELENNIEIEFLISDIFDEIDEDARFDLIISNPPYIPDTDKPTWQKELDYEPQIALTSGQDGMDFYNQLIPKLSSRLVDGGAFMGEIHPENLMKMTKLTNASDLALSPMEGLSGENRFVHIWHRR